MKLKSLKFVSASVLLLFCFSCLTINIYFPEAEVQKAAQEIVDEIRKEEDKEKKYEDKDALMTEIDPMMGSHSGSLSLLPSLNAQEATEVTTPKIRALKQSLKERFPKIKPFFEKGNIGEGNDGYIKIRNETGLNLKEKSTLRSLEKDENNDRKNLYAEVAKAMEIKSSQIEKIQEIFAQLWIEKANPGWWIQKESGEWVKKQ
ncbi:MAG: YdbL family protein [Candidatus Aminicenantes bacterium]|nr:YdbL family protein [Candidatus Aminicenantes bacterium]